MSSGSRKISNVPSRLPVHQSKLRKASTPSPRPPKMPLTPFHPTRLTTIYEDPPTKLPKLKSIKSPSPLPCTPSRSEMTRLSSRLPQPSLPMKRVRIIRKETRPKLPTALARQRPIVPELVKTSCYEAAHLDQPCTVGALMHVLEPCGHRLLTVQPELCAANCKPRRSAEQLSAHCQLPNPKDLSAPFICPTCVDAEVKKDVFQNLKSWTASGISCLHARRDSSSGIVKAVDPTTRDLCEKIAVIRAGHEVNGRKCYAYEDERMLYDPDTLPAPKSPGQATLAYGVRIYTTIVSEMLEKKRGNIDYCREVPEQSVTLQSIDARFFTTPRVQLLQDEVGRLKSKTGKASSKKSSHSSST